MFAPGRIGWMVLGVVFSVATGEEPKPRDIFDFGDEEPAPQPLVIDAAKRADVPGSQALAVGSRQVKEKYKKEYAKGSTEPSATAVRLKKCAEAEPQGSPARFVLYRDARDLAAGCADGTMAVSLSKLLIREYKLEPGPTLAGTIADASRAAQTPEACRLVAESAMECMRELNNAQLPKQALQIEPMARSLAERSRDAELKRRVEQLVGQIKGAKG
jgi:hypothetical protein